MSESAADPLEPLLRRVDPTDVRKQLHDPVDPETIADAAAIVAQVRRGGRDALIELAQRFGDLEPGAAPGDRARRTARRS